MAGQTVNRSLFVTIAALMLTLPFAHAEGPFAKDEHTMQLWHFDEGEGTAAKDSIHARVAQVQGGVGWTEGRFGRALRFNGTDGKLVMDGDGFIIFKGDQGFTVEAWVKVFKQGATQQIISCTPHYEMEVRAEGGMVSFNLQALDGSSSTRCTGQTDITDAKWHHVATVRDPATGTLRLYIDGLLDAETKETSAGKEVAIYRAAVVGGRAADNKETLGGIVDEIRVSSVARKFGEAPSR